eukprot:14435456-Alexandrium_andersonii.AAC.1
MTLDVRGGQWLQSPLARAPGPDWGHAALGWTGPNPDVGPRASAVALWAAMLDPPPGPSCRCLLGDRIRYAWPAERFAEVVAAEEALPV